MSTTTLQIGHQVTIDLHETTYGGDGTHDGVVIWIDGDLVGVDCGPNDDEFWINSQGREGYGVRRAQILRTRRPTTASREQAETVRRLRNLAPTPSATPTTVTPSTARAATVYSGPADGSARYRS